MAQLRWPIFLLALLVILVIIMIERSAVSATAVAARLPAFATGSRTTAVDEAISVFTPAQKQRLDELRQEKADEIASLPEELSGFGVESLQFVDGFLLFTIALMTLALVVPEAIQAKIQGVITLIFAIILIIVALIKIFVVIAKLITMVAMLLSFPFGTLAYLIIFGSFPRSGALAVLSLLFILKVIFGVLLLLAHQGFLKDWRVIIFVLLAFIGNFIVAFLYGIVPGFLVSITDAIAAIVLLIVGIVAAILLGLGGIISFVLALKP